MTTIAAITSVKKKQILFSNSPCYCLKFFYCKYFLLKVVTDIQIISSSNQKQRAWTGDEICAEDGPSPSSKKVYEVRSAPWCYVPDIPSHIFKTLDSLKV